jgi:hypothetical protein
MVFIIVFLQILLRARGGVVCWGTMLQPRKVAGYNSQ